MNEIIYEDCDVLADLQRRQQHQSSMNEKQRISWHSKRGWACGHP
ncbi:hypothetical protein [Lysinibacillus cavernae]|nr:hypothetical protein [Lysinibacillus cavernae]